jgi:tetratricopeptide (TPR) repeat protein
MKEIQQIDDQNPMPSYYLGGIFLDMGQYDKAITELERAVEIEHKLGWDNSWFYSTLGSAYLKNGEYKKAEKLYRKAEKYFKDDQWIIGSRAVLFLTEKDSIEANRNINELISFCKKNSFSETDITLELAGIYKNAGIMEKAEELYRKALSAEPDNPARMKDLANFFIENNRNLSKIPELMDKAMELAKNKIDYYDYLNTKGWALYKQGKTREALEILQKCWDEAPFKLYSIKSHLEEVKKAVASKK